MPLDKIHSSLLCYVEITNTIELTMNLIKRITSDGQCTQGRTGSSNRPGKFSLTGPHYLAKTQTYHDTLVVQQSLWAPMDARFALKISNFNLCIHYVNSITYRCLCYSTLKFKTIHCSDSDWDFIWCWVPEIQLPMVLPAKCQSRRISVHMDWCKYILYICTDCDTLYGFLCTLKFPHSTTLHFTDGSAWTSEIRKLHIKWQ